MDLMGGKHHRGTDYYIILYTIKDTISVEQMVNHIHCETKGKLFGYRDLVKKYAPVWTNSMCNELGCV